MRVYLDDPSLADDASRRLADALALVGSDAKVERGEVPDEDWKLSYRRHFKTEEIGRRLVTVPAWEKVPDNGRVAVVNDTSLAFCTGNNETTPA